MARRGASFRGVARYLFHDKGRADTAMRVAWSDSVNCWTEKAEDAWFEMWDTYKERDSLKAAAGVDRRGRDSTKPVLHYSLAWHPDEAPTRTQMRDAALASLKALGLEDHQAFLVAHCDEKHPHVHVVVNTIHPHTGKSNGLDYSKEALSKWAEGYEREHGVIRCEQRVRNNEDRKEIRRQRAREKVAADFAQARGEQPKPGAPYKPIKDRSPTRPRWLDNRAIGDRMKALHAELSAVQKLERGVTWGHHQQQREAIEQNTRERLAAVRERVRASFKPKWREIYRTQKTEIRYVRDSSPLARSVFVTTHDERLAGRGKLLTAKERLAMIASPAQLMKRLALVHERERQQLAREEKVESKTLSEAVWKSHREKMHTIMARQDQERAAEKEHHKDERSEVTYARAKEELRQEAPSIAPHFDQAAEPPSREELFRQAAEKFRAAMRSRPDREREP